MYENFAWEQFVLTGNIETFLEYKKLSSQIYEKKGENIDETCQGQGNCDKRSNI